MLSATLDGYLDVGDGRVEGVELLVLRGLAFMGVADGVHANGDLLALFADGEDFITEGELCTGCGLETPGEGEGVVEVDGLCALERRIYAGARERNLRALQDEIATRC